MLAGGGAKGAYAYGCMAAFRDLGITFEAVAGTSVGALNAAIWSRQAFEVGDALWSELSFATVLPPRRRRWMPRFLYYLEGIFKVLLHLHLATLSGIPNPGRRVCSWSNAALIASPILLVALLAPYPTHWPALTSSGQWLLFAGIMYVFAVTMLRSAQIDGDLEALALGKIMSIFLPSLLVLVPVALEFLVPKILGNLGAVAKGLGPSVVVIVIALTSAVTWVYLRIVRVLTDLAERATRQPFFDNTLLQRHVARVLEAPALGIAVFVCTAVRRSMFTGWVDLGRIPKVHRTPMRDTLARATSLRWVPRYVDITTVPRERAEALLIASAALPFGLLPAIELDGDVLVDGGIIDNVPVFPVLDGQIDEIFVVLLDQRARLDAKDWGGQWVEIDLLLRSAEAPMPPESIHRTEESNWTRPGAATPPAIPDIVVFQPRRSIGGFLSGTLNFHGAYARKLMELGRSDALCVLADTSSRRGVGPHEGGPTRPLE